MEVKTSGSGVITYGYGTFGEIFADKGKKQKGKKARSKDTKGGNLGLMVGTEEMSSEWKTHTCYFKVKAKKSELNTYVKVFLGEYMGEFKMRKPSVVKAESPPDVGKKGIIEIQ